MFPLLKRSLSSVTYSSLCLPEDIAQRGMEDVPNFHYRDDGLKLWDIINRSTFNRQHTSMTTFLPDVAESNIFSDI